MTLWIKICGMCEPRNLRAVAALRPDAIGLIFYPKSRRFMVDRLAPAEVHVLDPAIVRVGVFVDADIDEIKAATNRYGLGAIQLHGDESPRLCEALREQLPAGVALWKVWAMDADFVGESLAPYVPWVDRFLFDTRVPGYGGAGKRFDWGLLSRYSWETPYLLAGGIGIEQIAALQEMQRDDPRLVGFDANSRVEAAPGVKDIPQVLQIIREVRR